MTANSQYLDIQIKKSGLKKSYLASKLGISRQSFSTKCKEPSRFTCEQVSVLCDELNITRDHRDRIFFA